MLCEVSPYSVDSRSRINRGQDELVALTLPQHKTKNVVITYCQSTNLRQTGLYAISDRNQTHRQTRRPALSRDVGDRDGQLLLSPSSLLFPGSSGGHGTEHPVERAALSNQPSARPGDADPLHPGGSRALPPV